MWFFVGILSEPDFSEGALALSGAAPPEQGKGWPRSLCPELRGNPAADTTFENPGTLALRQTNSNALPNNRMSFVFLSSR